MSESPLLRKLGVKPDSRLALIGADEAFESSLGPLPPGVVVRTSLRGRMDVIVAFFRAAAPLRRRLPALVAALEPDGGLWIAWPKRASGVATDLSDDVVRTLGLKTGLVDNKVCAVNDVFSGLRFVYRLRDRP